MKRLAIFASGTGTNANAIIEHFNNSSDVKIALVLTNKPEAGVIQVAERHEIEWAFFANQDVKDEDVLMTLLDEFEVTHIVLAGWLQLIPKFLTDAFADKIVNIHPALLPKFGGKGMYGHHVHQAVFDAKETESGITIHLVNEEYDKGAVLAQHKASLDEHDTPESIEQKVRKLELKYFPKEIENWLR